MDPSSLFGDFDFGASFGDFCAGFGEAFEFGAAFDAGFGNFNGSVSIVFDDASLSLGGWFAVDVAVKIDVSDGPITITALRA